MGAGTCIATDYTRFGTAEKKKSGDGKSKSTGDKIGWVAAVAGGAVVALIVGDTASCGPGEDKSSGSD